MGDLFLVEPGWVESVLCDAAGAPGVRALFYEDGRIGIEHRCKEVEPGQHIICAPRLRLEPEGHRIVSRVPLTIEPSISCPDCGLHGHITAGRWTA